MEKSTRAWGERNGGGGVEEFRTLESSMEKVQELLLIRLALILLPLENWRSFSLVGHLDRRISSTARTCSIFKLDCFYG